ncbi:type II toxin-antitoxin system RelE/ParE family toxin [Neogemmobacter tilapiae]|uniref:Type II toxin-antitoxin system RelE/ParE family toxin n=1 Tax=Neogemmobacter tilapiae TaxID=875041 RepID=A0A918WLW0_9RHOB|nr:type II toxin-antitoxin system RelE/ParE family toxin [Gemmobacter tilapiae]GHC57570.1 hypothetical protein GCM10007315_21270 [Gemmobacter tilapiae]
MKPLNFSPRSERALEKIALWSAENFGVARARRYSADLLAACNRITRNEARWRYCRDVFAPRLHAELRFTRSGRHFIIFLDTPDEIQIIDFIHQSADIGGRLESSEE